MSGFFLCIKGDPQLDVDVLWQSPCANKTREDAVFFFKEKPINIHEIDFALYCLHKTNEQSILVSPVFE